MCLKKPCPSIGFSHDSDNKKVHNILNTDIIFKNNFFKNISNLTYLFTFIIKFHDTNNSLSHRKQ